MACGCLTGMRVPVACPRLLSLPPCDSMRVYMRLLQLGGNAALIKFFKENGVNDLGIRDKYHSAPAELYKER